MNEDKGYVFKLEKKSNNGEVWPFGWPPVWPPGGVAVSHSESSLTHRPICGGGRHRNGLRPLLLLAHGHHRGLSLQRLLQLHVLPTTFISFINQTHQIIVGAF